MYSMTSHQTFPHMLVSCASVDRLFKLALLRSPGGGAANELILVALRLMVNHGITTFLSLIPRDSFDVKAIFCQTQPVAPTVCRKI